MQTPQKLPSGEVSYYGLGWGLFDDEPDGASHGGSTPGFSGMIYMNRRNRISVAILTNLEDAPERSDTAWRIARAALGTNSRPQPTASNSP